MQTQGKIQADEKGKEAPHQHDDMERIEAMARKLANMPGEDIFTVKLIQ